MNLLYVNITVNWIRGKYRKTIISFQTQSATIENMMQQILSEILNTEEVPSPENNIKKIQVYAYKTDKTSDFRTLRISGNKTDKHEKI